jgi:hypothetical protein
MFRRSIGHSQAPNNSKQDTQCNYNAILSRVRDTVVAAEKQ